MTTNIIETGSSSSMNEVIITAFLIGLIFAPLGCVVLWKRYVYYGDGLAHASILAGITSVILNVTLIYAGIIIAFFFALAIFKFRFGAGNNAAIGLTSSVMMSMALVLHAIYPENGNIYMLLFGDIISVTYNDITGLCILLGLVSIFMFFSYRKILLLVFNRDIAHANGVNVAVIEFIFLTILSFAILYTVKIVGALLVTSIIIIPAMCGRLTSSTPLSMIFSAIIFVLIMNITGVMISFAADLPFAPTIVLSGGAIFLFVYLLLKLTRQSVSQN